MQHAPNRDHRLGGALAVAGLAALLLALAALVGCMPKTAARDQSPTIWTLSPRGERIYSYLLFRQGMAEGNATLAEGALEHLLALDPSPSVVFEAAEFYWRKGDLTKTRAILKQGLELDPGNLYITLLLTDTYITERRIDDAVLTLQDFLDRNENPDMERQALSELASLRIQAGEPAKALEAIERVPEADQTAMTLYYKGRALSALERHDEAVAVLRKAVDMDPELVEAWAELAYVQEVQKNYLAAEDSYSRLLELGENRPEIWLRLIDINLKLNRPDKALELAKRGPENSNFIFQASNAFMDQQFYDQAKEILEPLLHESPPPEELYFHLAVLAYEGDKDIDKAIDYLSRVPEDSRHYDRGLRFRASLLFESGRKEESLELVKLGQERYPDNKAFLELEASYHEDRKDYAKALDTLDRALVKFPDDSDLLYAKGLLLDKMDRKREGLQVMEGLLQTDPENADAMNYVGYILTDLGEELDRAYGLISKALELEPDSGYIIDSLAWNYYKREEFLKAWEAIQDAVAKSGEDPTIWEHYGDIATMLDKREEAVKAYKQALEMGSEHKERIERKLQNP